MATRAQQADKTRQRIVAQARTLFAERGFYGVSIAHVAAALGLSKQGVLHHFNTKEKLYGSVLGQIAGELVELKPDMAETEDPLEHLVRYFQAMIADTPEHVDQYMLLVREILDNRLRAETAHKWYLKPFLEDLAAMVSALPEWRSATKGQVLAVVVQLIGAVSYQAVSRPTFRGVFGAEQESASQSVFPAQTRTLVLATLKAGPTDALNYRALTS